MVIIIVVILIFVGILILLIILPPLTIKYCRIVSRPPMLKLNTALRVQVCCCLWVSIGAAERSPGSVAEFDFGFLLFVVARLGMSFSASSYQNECGVWSGNLFNAMLTRNMRKSSWQYFIVRGCPKIIERIVIPTF